MSSKIETNTNIIKADKQPIKLTPEMIAIAAKLMVDGITTRAFFEKYIENHDDKTEAHGDLNYLVINLLKYLENEEAKGGAKPELHTDPAHIKMMTAQISCSISEIVDAIRIYVTEATIITQTIKDADGVEETRTKKSPPPFDKLGWTVTDVSPAFGKIVINLSPMEDREQIFKATSKPSFKPKSAASGGGDAEVRCFTFRNTGSCPYGKKCHYAADHKATEDSEGFKPVKSSKSHAPIKPERKKDCHHFLNLDDEEGGCAHGDKCHFLHDKEWALSQAEIAHKKSQRLCNFFRNPDKCKYGDECRHYHPTKTSISKMSLPDEEDDDELEDEEVEEDEEKPKPRAGAGAATIKVTKDVLQTYADKAKPKSAMAFKSKGKAGK